MAMIEESEESREALDIIGIVKGEVAADLGSGTLRERIELDP